MEEGKKEKGRADKNTEDGKQQKQFELSHCGCSAVSCGWGRGSAWVRVRVREANPARLDAALVLLVAVVKVFCALPNDEANICKVATGKLGPVRTWTRVTLPAELDNFSQRRPLGFCHFTTHAQTQMHTYTEAHTQPHTLAKILFLLMLRRLQRAASACPSHSVLASPFRSPSLSILLAALLCTVHCRLPG